MDGGLTEILTAVSTVGFPIVACGALFVQNWKLNKDHKEEVAGFVEALENNTLAITKLTTLMEAK